MDREQVMAATEGGGDGLQFDKDNQVAMNFVAAASNLRSRVFQVSVPACKHAVVDVYCSS